MVMWNILLSKKTSKRLRINIFQTKLDKNKNSVTEGSRACFKHLFKPKGHATAFRAEN